MLLVFTEVYRNNPNMFLSTGKVLVLFWHLQDQNMVQQKAKTVFSCLTALILTGGIVVNKYSNKMIPD